MKQTLFLASLLSIALATGARAQEQSSTHLARYALRAGFSIGNGFFDAGRSQHLEGFELGLDVPLTRRPTRWGSLSFSPTVLFGGSNRGGNDTDGNLYRLMVTLRRPIHRQGLYAGLGMGVSFADARNQDFRAASGFTGQFLLGYTFHAGRTVRYQPFVEFSYYAGAYDKLSGFSLNAGVRF